MAQGYIECLLSGSRMYRVLVEWLKGSRMCHDSRELKTEKEGINCVKDILTLVLVWQSLIWNKAALCF